MDFSTLAAQEVRDFHVAITAWFRGETAKDKPDEVLQRLRKVFVMVAPDGTIKSYDDLAAWLPGVFGTKPDFTADTDQVVVRYITPSSALITYRETQQTAAATTMRRSSALFVADDAGGVLWRHLQETWM